MPTSDDVPPLDDLLADAHVVAIPLVTRFRGIELREAMLLRGPQGWTEFSPFTEYGDEESAAWLAAAIDFGWNAAPAAVRDRIPVNATLPAVPADEVEGVLARYAGTRTVKVKVAEPGQGLADDVARVSAARAFLGPEGRLRVDANGGWNVDEAEHAAHALAGFDLEYLEQPCATVDELVELRGRLHDWQLPIAADESVRKADDPLAVARAGAADILVIKAQPLGGIRRALDIVAAAGLPVVVSSALDTSVGISMGAALAASIPELNYDCGLATVRLLEYDVAVEPLIPVDGAIDVRRVEVNERVFRDYGASQDRENWWQARLERCYRVLQESAASA
ncbi:MAG TPA: o-succinylbenzoate synthase [Pseudolysinimonas sp.]|jgi:O-succinylbenzoate synthase